MQYELFYLVASAKEADLEKIKESVTKIVTEEGGVFEPKMTQERRKLAYEIKHETHGFYMAQRFNLEDTSKVQEIIRKLNLNVDVLRSVISRADELPELMTKEERIEAANRPVRREPVVEAVKPTPAPVAKETEQVAAKEETPVVEAPQAPTEEKSSEEDIDKKLEEILNI
jgi:small subunit ribosomal protein S6